MEIMEKLAGYILSAKFVSSVIFVACAFLLWFLFKRMAKHRIQKGNENDSMSGKKETYIRVLVNIIKYVLVAITAIAVLQMNGINVTTLVAGLGIAGAVAGLALQDALKDIIMGTNIITENFFIVGDVVRYKEIDGKVIGFGIKTTKIRDIATDNVITICNRNISEITRISDWLDIDIPTSYTEMPEKVRGILSDLAEDIKSIDNVSGCTLLGTQEFDSSAVVYRMRIICPADMKPPVRRAALGLIYDRLLENNVSIPYQQIDIHYPENKVSSGIGAD